MKKKYVIEVNLKSPMLIKSGIKNSQLVNSSGFVERNSEPFIPGSTLKGIVRANFSSLVYDEPCTEFNCSCPVCSIFGSGGYNPARIYFSDLMLVKGSSDRIYFNTSIRFHNSINRYLGVAKDNALFSEEVVESGQFKGVCEVYFNKKTYKYEEDIRLAIKMIESIGTAKSRGYGFVDINIKEEI